MFLSKLNKIELTKIDQMNCFYRYGQYIMLRINGEADSFCIDWN
jgi:hypothetical protein